MKASFVDLRNKSREILQALRRNERVTLLYRGKPAAVIHPVHEGKGAPAAASAADHAAFGLWADHADMDDVAAHVRDLRRGRFGDR